MNGANMTGQCSRKSTGKKRCTDGFYKKGYCNIILALFTVY